jgi:hypothetical protein
MKYNKVMLVIVTLLIGMIIPNSIKAGFSTLLYVAMFVVIVINPKFFFGDDTKKATAHRHE